MRILKTKLEKELEGNNKWLTIIINKLQSKPRYLKIDFEIIIIQAISKYLTGAIDFRMFIAVISRVQKVAEENKTTEINTVIKKLLTLSKYSSNPETNKKEIIETLNATVNKIEMTT